MASILDILNTPKGEELAELIKQQTSESPEKISIALSMALPLILGAMNNNLSTSQGLNNLNEALEEEKYQDSSFGDIKDQDPSELIDEGSKIVDHIFGASLNNISAMLSSVLQIKENNISDIIKISAPFLMNILATQKRNEKIEAGELGSLLDSVLGSSSQFDNSFIETLVQKGTDGRIIEDINGMILGGGNKGKGGSILGGMLGGK